MLNNFILLLVALTAANASLVYTPTPVVRTTVVGESGTITEERPAPFVPVLFGHGDVPVVIAEAESKKLIKSFDDSEAVAIDASEVPEHPILPAGYPPFAYNPAYYGYLPYPYGYSAYYYRYI